MEAEHVKASNEHVQTTSDQIKHEDETPSTEEKAREVSSPSNSPLEVYTDEKGPLHNSSAKPDQSDENSSSKHESVSSPVMISASPIEETATQKSSPEPTETKSPPIQIMGQPPGYDPNRIPSSIFASKTGNPTDWSATSNESLFSIHMGNNSFSRDYAILFGKSGELPKLDDSNVSQSNPFTMPGELPRLEEWNTSNSNHPHVSAGKSSEFGGLPPVMEVPSQEESSVLSSETSTKDEDISPKFVSGQTMENHGNENAASAAKKPPLPENSQSSSNYPVSFSSPSRLSDASGHSGSSFAFPVLAGNDSGKNDSMKVVPEKLEKPVKAEQPEAKNQGQFSNATPTNITSTRWFSCFSCWPRFC